jgi:cytosine/adenosine deaminase-related metal-dependent hydrolase
MKKTQQQVSGLALVGEDLLPSRVDIFIEDGTIAAVEENPNVPEVWICPAFFNAHTHLGDTIAMDCAATGDLAALVTPPDGLKHRLLAAATRDDLVAGMRSSIRGMIAGGTAGCADFREGGPGGVAALRESARGLPFRTCIFGRDGGEAVAGGLGISSARDVPDTEHLVAEARRAGKMVAFHAGERDKDDVDLALSFDPDLIIHATRATKGQIRQCAEKEIPVVVCPRSNWTLRVASSPRNPPLALMEELGCTVWLGTDNVMFVDPDMPSEMSFASTVYGLEPSRILQAAIGGSEMTGLPFFIREGARANLVVIDPGRSSLRFSRDPLASLVKRVDFAVFGNNVFNS